MSVGELGGSVGIVSVKVYDDEYAVGWLCKNFEKFSDVTFKCRRPRGHTGEHQGGGWKWWIDTNGTLRKIRLPDVS